MAFFIFTDSDWKWSDAEGENGECGPIIIEADNEQEAAIAACAKICSGADGADGGHLKIARIETIAFVGFEKIAPGAVTVDDVQFINEVGT